MIKLPSQSARDASVSHSGSSALANNKAKSAPVSNTVANNSTNSQSSSTATNPTNTHTTSGSADIKSVQQQLQQRQVVSAEVVSTQALNKQDQALLQKTQPSLFANLSQKSASTTNTSQAGASPINNTNNTAFNQAGINKETLTSTSNASNIAAHKLAGNQALTLYLIKLVSQQQSLTTLSTTRLLPGDKVQIQQNSQQQLQIQTLVANGQLKTGIIDSYKQALPLQKTTSQTLQVAQLLQQLPSALKQQLLPIKLLAALENVTQFVQSDKTLQQPQQLQAVIKNSGLFLESKIHNAATHKNLSNPSNNITTNQQTNSTQATAATKITEANTGTATTPSNNSITNDLRTALGKLQQQLSPSVLTNKTLAANVAQNTNNTINNTTHAQALSSDNAPVTPSKSNLYNTHSESFNSKTSHPQKLEQFVQLLLTTVQQQTPASNTTPQHNTLPTKELQNILQLLGIRVGAEQTPQKAATEFIGQQLKQMIHGANEKNRLNQLRSLGIETTANNETNTPKGLSFSTEIPLRWGEQVLPLHLSIREQAQEQHHEDNTENNADKETESARQWHVFLSFELPNNEQLHTQVSLVEQTLSATVWAESEQLCNKAQKKLGQLRKNLTDNGFMVEDIYCIQGKPPQQDTSLAYNLVDIKT